MSIADERFDELISSGWTPPPLPDTPSPLSVWPPPATPDRAGDPALFVEADWHEEQGDDMRAV